MQGRAASTRLLRGTRGAWLLAAIAIVALPASWSWWSLERAAAERVRLGRDSQAAMAPLHERVASRIRQWQSLRDRTAAVQQQLAGRGETPDRWEQRSITVEGQRMSRTEAEQYLRGLMTTGDTLLVPSAIHLKAGRPGDSVFAEHQGQDHPEALVVTIKADFYTRRVP